MNTVRQRERLVGDYCPLVRGVDACLALGPAQASLLAIALIAFNPDPNLAIASRFFSNSP